jgi:hypothetical protein
MTLVDHRGTDTLRLKLAAGNTLFHVEEMIATSGPNRIPGSELIFGNPVVKIKKITQNKRRYGHRILAA